MYSFHNIFIAYLIVLAMLALLVGYFGIKWLRERPTPEEQREFLKTTPGTQVIVYNDGSTYFREEGGEEYPAEDTITRMVRIDWIAEREYDAMKLRAEKPHLFADDWFDIARKELSEWSVEMASERARYRKRMKLSAA